MLYTEETVRDNIRNREGRRVFFLGKEDRLTPGARDWLNRERIEILPGSQAKIDTYRLLNGGILTQKPEHMTHLHGDVLVEKTHPRIAFRGSMDTLESEILLCQLSVEEPLRKKLGQLLNLARMVVRCEVLEQPLPEETLCGMTEDELRRRSHRPQEYYNQPHFMPEYTDGPVIVRLNRLRCSVRETERLAVAAFTDRDGKVSRGDILRALNRMSSLVYILMLEEKSER